MESESVMVSAAKLEILMESAVRRALASGNNRSIDTKKFLDIDQAVVFLDHNGFRVSKSHLYKLTSQHKVPHQKFGKRIQFGAGELLDWALTQVHHSNQGVNRAISEVAKSARKHHVTK